MIIYMNFQHDIEQITAANLKALGLKDPNLYTADKQSDLLLDNLMRQVPVQKYNVHISKELAGKLTHVPVRQELLGVINCFQSGLPIYPYLSKKVGNIEESDPLLKHWGINHLHPVADGQRDKQGFIVKRSSWILFFRVDKADAYLIDVLSHPKGVGWSNQALVQIADRNWPHLHTLVSTSREISEKLSDADYHTLRSKKKNANALVMTDRGQVAANFGVVCSGASLSSVVERDYVQWVLAKVQDEIRMFLTMHEIDCSSSNVLEQSKKAPYVRLVRLVEAQDDGWLCHDSATGRLLKLPKTF